MHGLFFELTLVMIIAGCIALLISFFKQPAIIAYLLTGLIVGPLGYYQLKNLNEFNALAEIGITLLLFLIGLELDISQIKKTGVKAAIAGIVQVCAITGLTAFGLFSIGVALLPSILIGAAVAFSSTVITVKMLTQYHDLHTLHGRLMVTVLLIQDFAAIFILIALNQQAALPGLDLPAWQNLFFSLIKAAVLVWIVYWHSTYLFPRILRHIGKSDELLLVFSLAWALGLASLVSLPWIGFSLEIGGFLAGLSLAKTAVHYEISSRIKSVRDFFLILFFISLGARLSISFTTRTIALTFFLIIVATILKPLLTLVLLHKSGFRKRTALLAAVGLGQISEFSLIILAIGLQKSWITQNTMSAVAAAMIFSAAISAYLYRYIDHVYVWLRPLLEKLQNYKGKKSDELFSEHELQNHVIVVGAHVMGRHIIDSLHRQNTGLIVVDQNPSVVEQYDEQHIPAICGDITDEYIQEACRMQFAHMIISTIPDETETKQLLKQIKKTAPHALCIVTARSEELAQKFYEYGASYVLLPQFIGGQHMAGILKNDVSKTLTQLRAKHLEHFTAP